MEHAENINKTISEDKLIKIDEALASNSLLDDKLNEHINTTQSDLKKIKTKEDDLIKSIDFLSKEIRELREENEVIRKRNANLEIRVDNQDTYNRRLKAQVNTLCVEKVPPKYVKES